jgi:hypothetical protein
LHGALALDGWWLHGQWRKSTEKGLKIEGAGCQARLCEHSVCEAAAEAFLGFVGRVTMLRVVERAEFRVERLDRGLGKSA